MSLLFKVRTRSERIDSMWGVLEDTVSLLRSHKVSCALVRLHLLRSPHAHSSRCSMPPGCDRMGGFLGGTFT